MKMILKLLNWHREKVPLKMYMINSQNSIILICMKHNDGSPDFLYMKFMCAQHVSNMYCYNKNTKCMCCIDAIEQEIHQVHSIKLNDDRFSLVLCCSYKHTSCKVKSQTYGHWQLANLGLDFE